MNLENLKALVYGAELIMYQKVLAQKEFEALEKQASNTDINVSIVKDIKTRKTNHMTALRKYQAGSKESINLKARISECNQITGLINDLNLSGVRQSSGSEEEAKALYKKGIRLAAIKMYAVVTGVGLKEAKIYCDANYA